MKRLAAIVRSSPFEESSKIAAILVSQSKLLDSMTTFILDVFSWEMESTPFIENPDLINFRRLQEIFRTSMDSSLDQLEALINRQEDMVDGLFEVLDSGDIESDDEPKELEKALLKTVETEMDLVEEMKEVVSEAFSDLRSSFRKLEKTIEEVE